jgi:hypothetical protein
LKQLERRVLVPDMKGAEAIIERNRGISLKIEFHE